MFFATFSPRRPPERLTIRDHILYHGLKDNRQKHTSKAGTEVPSGSWNTFWGLSCLTFIFFIHFYPCAYQLGSSSLSLAATCGASYFQIPFVCVCVCLHQPQVNSVYYGPDSFIGDAGHFMMLHVSPSGPPERAGVSWNLHVLSYFHLFPFLVVSNMFYFHPYCTCYWDAEPVTLGNPLVAQPLVAVSHRHGLRNS